MKPEPIRIEPELSPRIWGVRSLAPFFPEKRDLPEPIGEAWLTGRQCRIASGLYAGRTLREAWGEMPAKWRGTRLAGVEEFPILVKFIFPNDKLSIQVHPDDAYAALHEAAANGKGKTEMWHAVSAQPGAQVLIGLKSGTHRQNFLDALSAGTLEKLFEALPVRAGDTFFVPARTPHTIGPGMTLCEVQQYSDITYRVYDYGRVDARGKPRELHIEKALEVMNFGRFAGGKISALPVRAAGMKRLLLAACRYFATEHWELAGAVDTEGGAEHFDVLVILHGGGELAWNGGVAKFRRGETWFVPAALGRLRLVPEETTTLLRTYVPDVSVLKKALRTEGVEEPAISQVIFA